MQGPLKLRAHDAADLAVLSAHLQDALVPLRDMAWLPRQRRFILLANRFRWEREPEALEEAAVEEGAEREGSDAVFAATPLVEPIGERYSRTIAGLCFDRVTAVKRRNLDIGRRDRLLNLLALKPESSGVRLVFSGAGEVRLQGSRIVAHLEDLGEAWPTQWRPSHSLDDRGAAG